MILFFKEQVKFRLNNQEDLKEWIRAAFKAHGIPIGQINYIFCSDRYLLKMNRHFLKHDYFTDIITFDTSVDPKKKDADIFISVERVTANARRYGTGFRDELHRVMIHGALHLMGYSDKSRKAREEMRKQENAWLTRRKFIR